MGSSIGGYINHNNYAGLDPFQYNPKEYLAIGMGANVDTVKSDPSYKIADDFTGNVAPAVYDIPDEPGKEFFYTGWESMSGNQTGLFKRNAGAPIDKSASSPYGESVSDPNVKLYNDTSLTFANPEYNASPYWKDYITQMPVVEYKGALLYPRSTTPGGQTFPKLNFEGYNKDVWQKADDGTWSKQNFQTPEMSKPPEAKVIDYSAESKALSRRGNRRRGSGTAPMGGTLLQQSMPSGKDLLGN